MRVGIFTDTYYPEINGVATSAYQLKQELEKRGHQVFVFTVSNPEVTEPEYHVYRMGSLPLVLLKDRRVGIEPAIVWEKLVRALELDVIHTQTEFSVGHIGHKLAKKLGIPMLHTYHTIYEDYTHYLKVPGNKHLKCVVRYFSRFCCQHAQAVIVPTQKVERLLNSYEVKRKIFVQPTGVDLHKFARTDDETVRRLKIRYGLGDDQHIMLSIGRLSQEKNIDEILNMTKKMAQTDQKVRLLIVGDGPEKEHLISLTKELEITEQVIFAGEVPWKNIQNYYALGQIFVCASQSETQGLTYIEALAAGKTLLVRKDECLSGILQEGINGYSYQTEEEFIRGYERLFLAEAQGKPLHSHESKMQGMTANNLAESISSENFGLGIEKIYRDVINEWNKRIPERYSFGGERQVHEKMRHVVG